MMGPDFAGKLAAGIAPEDDASTPLCNGERNSSGTCDHGNAETQYVTQSGAETATDFNPTEFVTGPRYRTCSVRHQFQLRASIPPPLTFTKKPCSATSDEPSDEAFRKPGDSRNPPRAHQVPERPQRLPDAPWKPKATPESFSRIENLKELANAAQDAEERGESLTDFSTTRPWSPTPTHTSPRHASHS